MDELHASVAAAVDARTDRDGLVRHLADRYAAVQVDSALEELAALGWLDLRGSPRWTSDDLARVLPGMLSLLLDRYELQEMHIPDSPCWFAVASPRADADHLLPEAARLQAGRGAAACGFSRADALIRCLGEAAETVSACWHGNEPIEIACWDDVRERAVYPNDLMGYSDEQYATRDQWNAVHGEYEWIPPPLRDDTPIAWTPAREVATGREVLIPAAYAYIGFRDEGLAEPFYIADSNGWAVGTSEEDAIERGFLELVERDATGRWWYGQRHVPAVATEDVEAAGVGAALTWHSTLGRRLYFLNLTGDIGIPVCVAVSANPDGRVVLLGFGAARCVSGAVPKALAELVQMEMGLAMSASTGRESPGIRAWTDRVTLAGFSALNPDPIPQPRSPPLPPASRPQLEALTLKPSRHTARAPPAARCVIPGQTHYRPRLAPLMATELEPHSQPDAPPSSDSWPPAITF